MNDLHIQRLENVADRLSETTQKLVVVIERQEGHGDRIQKLEERVDELRDDHNKWKNRMWGAWAVVTAAVSFITQYRTH